jgi:hypothetical protein
VTQAAATTSSRVIPFAAASLAFCALGFAAASFAPDRRAALFGVGAAAASALFALPCVVLGLPHGTNGALAGFLGGFFARMVMVAVGLLLSGARGEAAVSYVIAFFALYALTQAVEVAYIWGSSPKRRAGA